MADAAKGDDIEALKAAIDAAVAAGVGKSKLVPKQQEAVAGAKAALGLAERLLRDTKSLKTAFYGLAGSDGSAQRDELYDFLGSLSAQAASRGLHGKGLDSDNVAALVECLFTIDADDSSSLAWGEFIVGLKEVVRVATSS